MLLRLRPSFNQELNEAAEGDLRGEADPQRVALRRCLAGTEWTDFGAEGTEKREEPKRLESELCRAVVYDLELCGTAARRRAGAPAARRRPTRSR